MTNQEAINKLIIARNVYDGMGESYKPWVEVIDMAISALQAQEAKHSTESSLTQKELDTISRQAAIDAFEYTSFTKNEIRRRLLELPTAQPEIIHCGDCKYKDDGIDEDGIPFLKCLNGRSYGGTRINDYCSWAERRTDGD